MRAIGCTKHSCGLTKASLSQSDISSNNDCEDYKHTTKELAVLLG